MLRVRDTLRAGAILDCSRTGSLSMLHSRATVQRLLHMFGAAPELWTNISSQAEVFAVASPTVRRLTTERRASRSTTSTRG